MTFGQRLKRLREAAGLTQEGLARAAGLSTSAVSRIEQGRVDPAWSTVQSLARGLGLNCQAFEESAPPQPAGEDPGAPPEGKKGRRKK